MNEMTTTTVPEVDVISQIVFSPDVALSQPAAEAILQLHFSKEAIDEIRQLREKNGEGALSTDEYRKLDSYRRVGQLLDMMHAQARHVLRNRSAKTP